MSPIHKTKRLFKKALTQDVKSAESMPAVPGYDPRDKRYALEAIRASLTEVTHAQAEENRLIVALKGAREHSTAVEWAFHDIMLGVKSEVQTQFGKDSDAVLNVGLKRKSDRKKPKRKPKASTGAATPPGPTPATIVKPAA